MLAVARAGAHLVGVGAAHGRDLALVGRALRAHTSGTRSRARSRLPLPPPRPRPSRRGRPRHPSAAFPRRCRASEAPTRSLGRKSTGSEGRALFTTAHTRPRSASGDARRVPGRHGDAERLSATGRRDRGTVVAGVDRRDERRVRAHVDERRRGLHGRRGKRGHAPAAPGGDSVFGVASAASPAEAEKSGAMTADVIAAAPPTPSTTPADPREREADPVRAARASMPHGSRSSREQVGRAGFAARHRRRHSAILPRLRRGRPHGKRTLIFGLVSLFDIA